VTGTDTHMLMVPSPAGARTEPAARAGDPAMTCNDPADAPLGTVVASSTVLFGD